MYQTSLEDDLEELSAAEEFLEYFGIGYEPATVQVNRLHILQRFHDYIAQAAMPEEDAPRRELYRRLLERAYQDFVASDALTEKVFRVFHMNQPGTAYVPVDSLLRR